MAAAADEPHPLEPATIAALVEQLVKATEPAAVNVNARPMALAALAAAAAAAAAGSSSLQTDLSLALCRRLPAG